MCFTITSAIVALMSVLFTGCISDSCRKCDFPLRLRFNYVFNREERDLLREETDVLRLDLYEMATGERMATHQIEVSDLDDNNGFEWEVPPGRHTLVTWGMSREGDNDRRYAVMNAGQGYSAHQLAVNTDGFLASEQKEAVEQSRQHLWHGCVTDIGVNGDISPVYDVELRKFSNDVNVNVYVQGDPLPADPECHISATNGRYAADGRVTATSPTYYKPQVLPVDPPAGFDYGTRHEFTTLSLWASDDSHLNLSVPGFDQPVYDGSLTELIDRLPKLDYDLDDVFDLDFFIRNGADGNLYVSISVNDWEIVNYNVTLK